MGVKKEQEFNIENERLLDYEGQVETLTRAGGFSEKRI